MWKFIGSCTVFGAVIFTYSFLPANLNAAINEQIPFYGTLQDTLGTNLSGTYDMVFRFYDAPSGGTLLDTSTHTTANGNPVTVTSGEFSAMLGSGTGNALDGIDFNTATIYVGITIGSDSEMTPRERLGSTAYSFNTDMLDGYDSLDLLRLNATNTIVASASTPLLTIRQNGTGDILNILDGATEVFTILDGGNVGIGNTAPGSKLSITGDISVSGAYRDTSGDAGTFGQVLLSTLTGTTWTSTSSLGIIASLGNNSVTPNNVLTTGQTDEYCLTYESTGSVWEWQTCGGGGSLFTDAGATTYLTATGDNLAIGTTTATERLTINGNIKLDGVTTALKFDNLHSLTVQTSLWSYSIGQEAGLNNIGYDNFFVGDSAGYNNTGDENTFIGFFAGYGNSGYHNIFFGFRAGQSNVGDNNNAFGEQAARFNSGHYNNIFGPQAGYLNTGDNNNILGLLAGEENSGDVNVLIGNNTGQFNDGSSGVFIGVAAGSNNAGNLNIGLGYAAGASNQGSNNIMFGDSAGNGNRGNYNLLFGVDSGNQNRGSYNSFLGVAAGFNNLGNYNDFYGYYAGHNLTSTSTVLLGAEAMRGTNIGYSAINNVAVGYRAGYLADTGADNNILIGYQSADNLTTGNNNIIIGYAIDSITATADNRLNIGNLIFGTGLDGTGTTFASGNIGIGTSSPASKLSVAGDLRVTGAYRDTSGDAGTSGQVLLSTITGTNWVATSSLGITATLGNNSVTPNNVRTTGQTDEYCLTYETTGSTWEWQTCGGGGSLFTDGGATTYLTSLADNLGIGTTTASEKLYVAGNIALDGGYIKFDDPAYGSNQYFFASTSAWTYAIGDLSGQNNSGFDNFFVGFRAGQNSSGDYNIFLNNSAGQNNTGSDNFFSGDGSGSNNTGSNGVFIGKSTGVNNQGDSNNFIGYFAGSNASTSNSYNNNFIGRSAGTNSDGYLNNFVGYFVGANNAGSFNTFIGNQVGRSSSGDANAFVGEQVGYLNTGNSNSALGQYAAYGNSGGSNTMLGSYSGYSNSGSTNDLIGYYAGYDNSGNRNFISGSLAGYSNQGDDNIFMGWNAGYVNRGDYNQFIGSEAGHYLNATSSVAIGSFALRGGLTSSYIAVNNTAIGYRAGYNIRAGSDNNIFVGYNAGDNITTGDNNIIIGYDVDHISPALNNRLNIGNLIFGTGLDGTGTTLASGNIGIGTSTPLQKLQVRGDIRVGTTGSNGCIEDYGGGVIGGTCSSDERLKTDIEPLATENRSYLEAISQLTPVNYKWNEVAGDLYSKDTQMANLGLIAQDVEAVFPELVTRNSDDYRQVDFRALPFYLIEAVKELWMKVSGLEEKVKEIDELERRIERLEAQSDIEYTPPPVINEPQTPPEAPPEPVVNEEVPVVVEPPESPPAVVEGESGL